VRVSEPSTQNPASSDDEIVLREILGNPCGSTFRSIVFEEREGVCMGAIRPLTLFSQTISACNFSRFAFGYCG